MCADSDSKPTVAEGSRDNIYVVCACAAWDSMFKQVMGEYWAWEINLAFAGSRGGTPLAAHASLQSLTFYYYTPMIGFMSAATVRVGTCIGSNRPARAWEECKTAAMLVGAVQN